MTTLFIVTEKSTFAFSMSLETEWTVELDDIRSHEKLATS